MNDQREFDRLQEARDAAIFFARDVGALLEHTLEGPLQLTYSNIRDAIHALKHVESSARDTIPAQAALNSWLGYAWKAHQTGGCDEYPNSTDHDENCVNAHRARKIVEEYFDEAQAVFSEVDTQTDRHKMVFTAPSGFSIEVDIPQLNDYGFEDEQEAITHCYLTALIEWQLQQRWMKNNGPVPGKGIET